MSQRFVVGNASLKNIRDLSDNVYAIELIINNSFLIIADPSFWVKNEEDITTW